MTKLVQIVNSKGIRIPKNIIKKAHLENTLINFEIKKDGLFLKPVKNSSREDWEQKIKNELDKNIQEDDEILNFDLDLKDWEW